MSKVASQTRSRRLMSVFVPGIVVSALVACGGCSSNRRSAPTTSTFKANQGSAVASPATVASPPARTTPILTLTPTPTPTPTPTNTQPPATVVSLPAAPVEWPAPEAETAQATMTFLSAVGAPISSAVTEVVALATSRPSPSTCQDTVTKLNAANTPGAFLDLAAQTPDVVLSELVADLVTVTGDALQACIAASPGGPDVFATVRLVLGYIDVRRTELASQGS